MIEFLSIPEARRRLYIQQASSKTGMSVKAMEKDWWVTLVLKAVFGMPMAQHFVFKGGTSLSKGWGLIERLSEDIDIALSPEAFGEQYKTGPGFAYVKKLKKKGAAFTSKEIADALYARIQEMGVPEGSFALSVETIQPKLPDKDPQIIFVHYHSLYESNPYLADYVKLEFGVRALKEPCEKVNIQSMIGQHVETKSYGEHPFPVLAVIPEKTMIEKMLLLHERFSNKFASDLKIAERQSRHLADIVELKKRKIHERVIADPTLFKALVEHRRYYIRLRGVDYGQMTMEKLSIVPPSEMIAPFRNDYLVMKQEMIYGEAPDFETILDELRALSEFFRRASIG